MCVCRLLGTPDEDSWENVSSLPDWQSRFPHWKKANLRTTYGTLGGAGVSLLEQLLIYDPRERIIGKEALNHPYYDSLDRDAIGKGSIRPPISCS